MARITPHLSGSISHTIPPWFMYVTLFECHVAPIITTANGQLVRELASMAQLIAA